jgi:Holliday junction resolvase
MLMNDTDPQIAKLVRQRLLERSGAERIRMASGMFEAAKAMALASFPAGLTEIEIKERLVERFYGNEVDIKGLLAHLRAVEPSPET